MEKKEKEKSMIFNSANRPKSCPKYTPGYENLYVRGIIGTISALPPLNIKHVGRRWWYQGWGECDTHALGGSYPGIDVGSPIGTNPPYHGLKMISIWSIWGVSWYCWCCLVAPRPKIDELVQNRCRRSELFHPHQQYL